MHLGQKSLGAYALSVGQMRCYFATNLAPKMQSALIVGSARVNLSSKPEKIVIIIEMRRPGHLAGYQPFGKPWWKLGGKNRKGAVAASPAPPPDVLVSPRICPPGQYWKDCPRCGPAQGCPPCESGCQPILATHKQELCGNKEKPLGTRSTVFICCDGQWVGIPWNSQQGCPIQQPKNGVTTDYLSLLGGPTPEDCKKQELCWQAAQFGMMVCGIVPPCRSMNIPSKCVVCDKK